MIVLSPITNSPDVTLLKVIQVEQLVHDWMQKFQINIGGELHAYEEIYLYQCNQTKLKFFYPLDIAGSAKLYVELEEHSKYYLPDRWEHQVALRDLSIYKNILEIGAASGYFIRNAIEEGLNIRGIELNQLAVSKAQEEGLPVEVIGLQDAAGLYERSLDAVCSFQVLEHVSEPRKFIEWSIQMLKPGGILIFCVPNSESFIKHEYNLLDMPPHHLTRWSEETFRALESIFPIKLEKVAFEPLASYHTLGYVSAYSYYFRSKFPLLRLMLNRHTFFILVMLLNLGLRKYIKGQCLYVKFRKT